MSTKIGIPTTMIQMWDTRVKTCSGVESQSNKDEIGHHKFLFKVPNRPSDPKYYVAVNFRQMELHTNSHTPQT